MPSKKPVVNFVIETELLAEIDDERRTLDPIPSRAKLMKDLMRDGLTSRRQRRAIEAAERPDAGAAP